MSRYDLAPRLVSLAALVVGCSSPERVVVVVQQPPPTSSSEAQMAATPLKVGPIKQLATSGGPSDDEGWGLRGAPARNGPRYAEVVRRVAAMVGDSQVRRGASSRGLVVQNVNWEDTGRATGSSLGPNISDLTLQVRLPSEGRGAPSSSLMPVIRFPNFADRTGDVPVDRFFVRVGNERSGGALRTVALTDVLSNLASFASMPESLRGSRSLLAPRDTHFLVSAQAVFLPIPKEGKAEFNPVLFNYQSAPGSPAVLSLLVTRQGTSMTVIENRPDERSAAVGSGQELYFNAGGQRAALTAERKGEVAARIAAQGGPKTEDDRSALAKGADVLFLIQVPLAHANRVLLGGAMPSSPPSSAAASSKPGAAMSAASPAPMGAVANGQAKRESSDVEQAVLGHGRRLGPFNEGRGLRLVRDQSLPIRITVQFYKATSNGVVSEADLDGIARSIGDVYEHAEFVGSLVVPEGDPRRPTAWQTMPQQWFPW